MREAAELQRRAQELRQQLLLAVKHTLSARLDGSDDEGDLALLMRAAEEVRQARDGLEQLCKRLQFYIELEQVRSGRTSDDGSRTLIALTRLGVEGGYTVDEVRQLIERALGRAPRS
ncbi:MAG: hypothetical protein NZ552_07635 [Planctomycetes bacterium]|nr:hypothetical protein [Planctomycetota bacterium]